MTTLRDLGNSKKVRFYECVPGVDSGTGIPTGSQSRDRFLDPGLRPGSTTENRDGMDFRPGSRFFPGLIILRRDLNRVIDQFHEKWLRRYSRVKLFFLNRKKNDSREVQFFGVFETGDPRI